MLGFSHGHSNAITVIEENGIGQWQEHEMEDRGVERGREKGQEA